MDEDSTTRTYRLVEAARGGDQAASRELIEILYPTVSAIVRNHLPWSESEEDLAQQIFLKVFARLGQFRGEKPIFHWVGRIALFTCYDALRRQRASRTLRFADLSEDQARFLEQSIADEPEGDCPQDTAQARELVESLLATLKPDQRLVVRLLDIERRTVKEISDLTGWKDSKIKVTAMRARRKLAATLARLEARTHRMP